ncbi:hypothetical protein REPUB_Repub16aG0097600 [Reevesia pubescens]
MDSHGQDIVEDILRVAEVELGKDREKTKHMKELLGADLAALKAKEIVHEKLKREKNQMLAVEQANQKLVADFLEADDKKNFDAQKDMLGAIAAAMNPGMLGVIEAAMNSGNMLDAIEAAIKDLAAIMEGKINTQNLDEEGTNGGGE